MGLFDKKENEVTLTKEDEQLAIQKEMDAVSNYKTIETEEKGIQMKPEFWSHLWKYIENPDITDVDYNGKELWLTYIDGRHEKVEEEGLTDSFIKILIQRIANEVSKPFNNTNPILEAETKDLRISVLHESVSQTGRSICVRKTPEFVRINTKDAIANRYATKEELSFLANCIKAKMNIAICGEPGVGKTELAKYLSSFIPNNERVITIEDTLEWHYESIHPMADTVALKVSDKFTYFDAIKASLRQNPKWLMLSEARGEEVSAYIQQLSTGTNGITTLHCDAAKKIPDRLVNMSSNQSNRDRMEYDIYNFLSVGVLVNKAPDVNNTERRFIDQIAVFNWDSGEKLNRLIFNDMQLSIENIMDFLPSDIKTKFERHGILDPLHNETIDNQLKG